MAWSHELWWLAHKLKRLSDRREIPLTDQKGRPFIFGMPDLVLELLRRVDSTLSGNLAIGQPVLTGESRDCIARPFHEASRCHLRD